MPDGRIALLTPKGFRLPYGVPVRDIRNDQEIDLAQVQNFPLTIMVEGRSEVAKLATYNQEQHLGGKILISDQELIFILGKATFQIYEVGYDGRQTPTNLRFRFSHTQSVALFNVSLT